MCPTTVLLLMLRCQSKFDSSELLAHLKCRSTASGIKLLNFWILHMSCTGPPQESRCAESIVQTLPQLQQAVVCEHLPGEPVPAPKQPLGEEPFPNAQPKPPVTQLHVLPTGSKGILTGSVSLLQSGDEEVICKLPKASN
ncbi:uncharacterized protein ACIQIH_005992 isoform 2-T2 [Cyanocitta cristata]